MSDQLLCIIKTQTFNFGRPFVKRLSLSYETVVSLSCPVCLRRWCVVAIAKRLHGCHLVRRCVGLDPGHILLDGDSTLPHRKGLSSRPLSQFTEACVCIIRGTCLLWQNGWMNEDATWYGVGLGSGDIELDGDLAPPQKGAHHPHLLAHVYCG